VGEQIASWLVAVGTIAGVLGLFMGWILNNERRLSRIEQSYLDLQNTFDGFKKDSSEGRHDLLQLLSRVESVKWRGVKKHG
jgi:hypothetical protein